MRVYLTGGTGQIGSQLARALVERGDEVTALVRDKQRLKVLDPDGLKLVEGDVTDPGSLRLAGHDAVIHCAGVVSYSSSKRAWQEAVNVGGTRAVLDAAALAGCERLVLTSSLAALGWVPEGEIGDENTAFNWQGLGLGYQETKKAAEDAALSEKRLDCIAVNPGIVMGSHDLNDNGGRVLKLLAAGGPPGVPCGHTTAVNLSDVIQGHLLALDKGVPGERYVLASWHGSFVELFALVASILEVPAPARVLSERALRFTGMLQVLGSKLSGSEPKLTPALATVSSRNRRFSSAKAEKELGFEPTELAEGIAECKAWYEAHGGL